MLTDPSLTMPELPFCSLFTNFTACLNGTICLARALTIIREHQNSTQVPYDIALLEITLLSLQ